MRNLNRYETLERRLMDLGVGFCVIDAHGEVIRSVGVDGDGYHRRNWLLFTSRTNGTHYIVIVGGCTIGAHQVRLTRGSYESLLVLARANLTTGSGVAFAADFGLLQGDGKALHKRASRLREELVACTGNAELIVTCRGRGYCLKIASNVILAEESLIELTPHVFEIKLVRSVLDQAERPPFSDNRITVVYDASALKERRSCNGSEAAGRGEVTNEQRLRLWGRQRRPYRGEDDDTANKFSA